jgi:hypothetical protein
MTTPLLAAAARNGDQPEPDSWEPIDLTTLPVKPPIQPTLGQAGIVYPGKRHVFSGPPESAKTLVAYIIGIAVIRNGGTIVLIDFEMGSYDARARLSELGATPDEIRRVRYLEPDTPANSPRIERLVTLQPQLVIIDAAAGAYDLQGLDDNKRGDVEKLSGLYVRSFWRNGIASIFVDHVVKNTETRGKFAIGSERKLGGADVHLGFETIAPISRGTTGHYKIVTHKDRGGYLTRGHLADFKLSSDPQTHTLTWELKPADAETAAGYFRPTHLMERVSLWLHTKAEPVPRSAVTSSVTGNAKHLGGALDVLVREHFAAETPGPRGAKLITHVRLFKEDDPDCNPETDPTSSTSSMPFLTSSGTGHLTSSSIPPPVGGEEEVKRPLEGFELVTSSWLDELVPDPDELALPAGTLDQEPTP